MKSENMIIRMNPILKQQAREEAEKEGKSLSEWVTDLIKLEIARKKESQ